jgi:hypothetical protein
MNYNLELEFQKLQTFLNEKFEKQVDITSLLFLIGVNELGKGYKKFTKNQKTDLMHVAVCTLLIPFGYYEFEKRDEENWPHFKLLKKLPELNSFEQELLLKEAILKYFIEKEYLIYENFKA